MSHFYITTPIYYINAAPHLGHAYTTMVADAIARARRLLGDEVFFLTGTDEHGQKVERAARKAGLEPLAFADQVSSAYRELFGQLEISNDDFIRTTEARHRRAVEAIWRRVQDAGDIYKGVYEGWYCTVDEIFVPETQLGVDRRCPDCGNPVEWLQEESYYFRLSRYQAALLEHYRANPGFVAPETRRNEMMAFLQAGLTDLSVSRTSFQWGIPVPDQPGHVMYVWFDALTNYLTAAGFGSDDPADRERFARCWPADVHLMGKEIVRQHAIYWPAFLMSAGLALPRRIVSHGWWLMNEAKMSKSLGNVVHPQGYVARFGIDALRYFLMREMTLGQDADFTDRAFLARYNSDLANDLGNLASRVTTMIVRYNDGVVPPPSSPAGLGVLGEVCAATISAVVQAVQSYDFSRALGEVWGLISQTNKFLVSREPWALARDPARRNDLHDTLYQAADGLRVIAALVDPVMPGSAVRLRRMLGVDQERWIGLRPETLEPGTRVGSIEPLFPRVERTVEELRTMAAEETRSTPQEELPVPAGGQPVLPASPSAVVQPALSIDEFMKIDLRVARIVAAERVPNSRKLIKMQVDLGTEQRTLVAGIAEAYQPDTLVGRVVVVVANLKPAKLMGIESNGMVLAASPEGGTPVLVTLEQPPPPGTRVR